ncbi:neuronal acetylcholine receptor subunit alpha-10-like [Diadema antillarum]|uniref:neuronal acetylcholine receptor subunit alpha-10-like n=1 Tax=Diadema antillarum TaxID=105358 RepID=UPI003A854443
MGATGNPWPIHHHPSLQKQNYLSIHPEAGSLLSQIVIPTTGKCSLLTKRLVNELFHEGKDPYNRHIRPTINETTPTHLKMQLFVSQILEMDERVQLLKANVWVTFDWVDEFLTWDPDDFEGLQSFKLTSDLVWMPNIVLYNNAGASYEPFVFDKIVKIDHTGHINWGSPLIIKATCQLNIANFPFDVQRCKLKFGPWQHDGSELIMEGAGDETAFRSDGEWDIIGMVTETNQSAYPDTPGVFYYDVTYTISIRRRALYYVFNLLVPCILIAAITLLGFLLPVDSGEKVSLGITVLLSLTVFLLLIAESMPPSSVVPIIGQYYVSTMVLVSVSILLTVSVINLHHRGPYCKRAPRWARKFILGELARYLRLQPDEFKHFKFASEKSYYNNANGGSGHVPSRKYRSKLVDSHDGHRSEKVKLTQPNESPILGISRGTRGKDGRGLACCEHTEDHILLMRRLIEHVRYIRDHYEGIDDNEDIRNEWKQIALVVDRMFAIFYVVGTIGTIMILVFKVT